MDNTSSIYVPHGSYYEDSSVFQYQKMNYESYHSNKLNKYKANNIRNTIFIFIGNKHGKCTILYYVRKALDEWIWKATHFFFS